MQMNYLGLMRCIAVEELELMRSWRNEPTIRANMYTQHEISQQEHMNWWVRVNDSADQQYFMYEMAGRPIGIAAFTNIDMKNFNSAWAFYSSPNAPRGTGSKMEYLMLERAFGVLQLHKLYCEVLAFNTPVIKLHQKFGFSVEGVFRKQQNVNNEFVDVYRLGILAKEWQEHRQAIYEKLRAFNKA